MKIVRAHRHSLSPSISVLMGLFFAGGLQAANFDYSASVMAGHSDNIGRTAENEIEDGIGAAELRFSLDQRTSRIDVDMVGDFLFYDYFDNTYESDFLGSYNGRAEFQLAPDWLQWTIADTFGQVLSDPFTPPTPENRENTNFLTTGPDTLIALGAQTRLRIGGRYTMTTYENQPLDSDAVQGYLSLARLLSEHNSVSLNGAYRSVSFDDALLNPGYDQTDAFVNWSLEGSRTRLSVDAGYSVLARDDVSEDDDGVLFRLELARRLSSSSTATLSGGREFASSATAFAQGQSSVDVGLDFVPGRQTAQPFVSDRISIDYSFARDRTGIDLAATWGEETYDNDPTLDQTLSTFTAYMSRDLSSRTSATVDLAYSRGDFVLGGDYTDRIARLSFDWRVSQLLSFAVSYDYFDRNADSIGGDSTENRYWLTMSYGRGRPRAELLPPKFAVDAKIQESERAR